MPTSSTSRSGSGKKRPGTTGRTTPKRAPRPEPTTVTPISDWKAGGISIRELPSGKTARIRIKGLDHFIQAGMIPNALLPIVTEALSKDDPKAAQQALSKLPKTMDTINQITKLMDAIVIACFVEPKVHALPESEDDRDPNLLYVDEVGFEDKSYVMNLAVGGTSDLETFRSELRRRMDAV